MATNKVRSILVTGGAGYIGSHVVIELIHDGYDVVILDNLTNSNLSNFEAVQEIVGRKIALERVDLQDKVATEDVFKRGDFNAVIHLAGLKSVVESCKSPIYYYRNNLIGTLNLLSSMIQHNIQTMIFSSSCTVYGDPQYLPVDEQHPTGNCTNPYGRTKYFIEQILQDIVQSNQGFNITSLRYFNPIGSHTSAKLGDNPKSSPKNLVPSILEVAGSVKDHVTIYGNDFDTRDGTGVRDYIHVVDLAKAHVAALNKIDKNPGFVSFNLGRGKGYTVMEVVQAIEQASGRRVRHVFAERRSGDVACTYASSVLANNKLNWTTEHNLQEMCRDAWAFHDQNEVRSCAES